MKLISLNAWGGNLFEPLMGFLEQRKDSIDIFSFQEIWSTPTSKKEHKDTRANLLQEIETVLSGHIGYLSVTQEGIGHGGPVDFELATGNAMFIRESVTLLEQGESFIHGEHNSINIGAHQKGDYSTNPRLIQWSMIADADGTKTTIFNLHGLVSPTGKGDIAERAEQSARIIETLKRFPGRKILSGDFNLLPDTQSIKSLEGFGLRNLIKEYGINSTRTSLYKKEHRFADYTFVSDDVQVKDFKILPEEVSDHNAMYLDFE